MSHFTTIQTQIRDLEALRDACVELGFGFLANAKCRSYAGVTRLTPHVIQLKGPYDIAVDPSPEKDGSYGLTTDWWDALHWHDLPLVDEVVEGARWHGLLEITVEGLPRHCEFRAVGRGLGVAG
jgi:hypothetical protein